MTAVRVIILCVSAAMICSAIRVQRPEVATAVSLAIGIGALLMTGESFSTVGSSLREFSELSGLEHGTAAIVLKSAGISIISELGVQICSDAGEGALAGRIRFSTRIVLLGMALPMVFQIMESVYGLFG